MVGYDGVTIIYLLRWLWEQWQQCCIVDTDTAIAINSLLAKSLVCYYIYYNLYIIATSFASIAGTSLHSSCLYTLCYHLWLHLPNLATAALLQQLI